MRDFVVGIVSAGHSTLAHGLSMRMLVTGGAGFIGSHLCDRLLERGAQVWCVDNLRLGRRRNIAHLAGLPAFRFVELDAVLHEDFAPLEPISFYGASKLASEAYISVFAHTFGGRAVVLRFPNVVGERATHGVIYDFLRKLKDDRGKLEVLGDGNQSKPYLYVGDLVEAALTAWDKAEGAYSVYHAAGIGETSVREIAEIVVAAAGRPDTRVVYSGGDRGWPGDVPRFRYDISRLQALGWRRQRHSTDAVRHAVERIRAN